jgi:hypothetical protein
MLKFNCCYFRNKVERCNMTATKCVGHSIRDMKFGLVTGCQRICTFYMKHFSDVLKITTLKLWTAL